MAEKERTMLKTIVANTLIEGRALSEYDYLYCRFGMEIEKIPSHRLKNARLSPEDKWGMKRVETLTICLVDPNSGTEPHWPVQAETVISRFKVLVRSGSVEILIMRSLGQNLAIRITCLICFVSSVSAFLGRLAIRQEACDTSFCVPNINWDTLVDTLGAWSNHPSQPDGYLQPGTLPPDTETQPMEPDIDPQEPKTRQDPNNLPTSNTDIELLQLAPNPGSNECQRAPPSADSPSDISAQKDEGNNNFYTCEKATQQLIFPRRCDDIDQNKLIEQIIIGMSAKFLTQRHPRCGENEGVFFWLAWLTPGQVETLRKDSLAIESILANIEAEGQRMGVDPQAQSNILDFTQAFLDSKSWERSTRVEKRSKVNVVEQVVDDLSLNFLSTAPGKQIHSTYKYFAQAGTGVTVLVIDTGLGRTSSDIGRARIIYRIYAVDIPVENRESDLSTERIGTCIAQKIGGVTFGVAKKAKFVIVTARPNYASVISALAEVIFYLDAVRNTQKQKTRGWTVINLRMSFSPKKREEEAIISQRFKELLEPLVQDHQAIVVTAAGEEEVEDPSPNNSIKTYPAKISLTHDILVVGAVLASKDPSQNGLLYPGSSNFRDRNMVHAPANGLCDRGITIPNDNNPVTTGRSSILSTAIVSGLVAYFLSLPDLANNKFRKGGVNTPAVVIEYLQQMSYSRSGGGGDLAAAAAAAVWNGLDSEDGREFYKDWYGTPPVSAAEGFGY